MKTDKKLGYEVRKYLIKKGVETPIVDVKLGRDEKIDLIRANMRTIIEVLGLDTKDDSISGTAARVGKMYVDELCAGMDYERFPAVTRFDNKMGYNQMVLQKDITFHSMCEHHFVNFHGLAQVAYIPNGNVVGLSKLNRVVNFFARRPQVQERLTEQVFRALQLILGTDNVAVYMECDHFCVKARGVEDVNSSMVTSRLGGAYFDIPEARSEFMSIVND